MIIRKANSTDAKDLKVLYFEYLTHFIEGRKEVMELLIQTCEELGLSKEATSNKIKTKFMLSDEETEDYLSKYWVA